MDKIRNNESFKWFGIEREEVNWYPSIDYSKCIGCGICVLECPNLVFSYDFKKHIAKTIKPLKCKIGCNTCANLCPASAISLPTLSYLRKVIKETNILSTCWEKLEYNKYMYM